MKSDKHRDQLNTVRQLIRQMLTMGERISDLSQEKGTDAMIEIVDLRRGLANQLPQLATACLEAIVCLEAKQHAEVRQQLIRLIGEFRTQLSRLQSQWPAVAIRHDPAGYRKARSTLNIAQTKLFAWLNDELLPTLAAR